MAFLIKISKRYSCDLFPLPCDSWEKPWRSCGARRGPAGARGGAGAGDEGGEWSGGRPGRSGSAHLTALPSAGVPVPALFPHPQHPELPGKHCRRRKARTVFSDSQLSGLEKRFEIQRYLSTPERVELATALSLSETQVGRRRGRPHLRSLLSPHDS